MKFTTYFDDSLTNLDISKIKSKFKFVQTEQESNRIEESKLNDVCEVDWGQFHQHFKRAFFVRKYVQSLTINRKKLLKRLSYQQCARKMLMKLTPGIFLSKKNDQA